MIYTKQEHYPKKIVLLHYIHMPRLTVRTCPVMKLASGLVRKRTAAAREAFVTAY